MKTPHLATAMLIAASIGGSMGLDCQEAVKASYSPQREPEERGIIRRRGIGANQRQKRKDRRRAFANGNRRAFN
jgi:hypothetical protein